MDKERKWSLNLSGVGRILLADVSEFLEILRVILFTAFHIEDVSTLSLTD